MSLGFPAGSPALDLGVREAIAGTDGVRPLTFVLAAGNSNNAFGSCVNSPGGNGVLTGIIVGATDQADARAGFSNFGPCLDVFAPGVAVRSATSASDTANALWDGTSFSAPLTAGRVALYLQGQTSFEISPAQVSSFITGYNITHGAVTNAGAGSPNQFVFTRSGPPDRLQFGAITRTACAGGRATYNASWNGNYGPEAENYDIDFAGGLSGPVFNGTGTSGSFSVAGGSSFQLNGRYIISQGTSTSRISNTVTAPACSP